MIGPGDQHQLCNTTTLHTLVLRVCPIDQVILRAFEEIDCDEQELIH